MQHPPPPPPHPLLGADDGEGASEVVQMGRYQQGHHGGGNGSNSEADVAAANRRYGNPDLEARRSPGAEQSAGRGQAAACAHFDYKKRSRNGGHQASPVAHPL